MISLEALRAINAQTKTVKSEMKELKTVVSENTAELAKINQARAKEELKQQKQVEEEIKKASLESSRYPLVQTSDPGMQAQIDLNLKKLNIL